MSYYNTAGMSGPQLKEKVQKCKSQEEAILTIFRETGNPYTPSQILRACERAGFNYPITSVRRCITDLTKDKKLNKLDTRIPGPYKEPETQWQYKGVDCLEGGKL